MSRNARWFLAAALLGVSLSGCTHMDLRGDPFPDDELSTAARQLRPRQTSGEAMGVSNQALQIEKDFGYQ